MTSRQPINDVRDVELAMHTATLHRHVQPTVMTTYYPVTGAEQAFVNRGDNDGTDQLTWDSTLLRSHRHHDIFASAVIRAQQIAKAKW